MTDHAGRPAAADLDRCLPQTQCTACGYPSCRDYADAMAAGRAGLNRCPPGGEVTVQLLAKILHAPAKALASDVPAPAPRSVARIVEARCIGCALCTPACPTDAIVGAAKTMHSVIAARCTGCGLCLSPCPMDCIELRPAAVGEGGPWRDYGMAEAENFRAYKQARDRRLRRRRDEKKTPLSAMRIREQISAAVARVRARRINF